MGYKGGNGTGRTVANMNRFNGNYCFIDLTELLSTDANC
jgi:hypothetical protein